MNEDENDMIMPVPDDAVADTQNNDTGDAEVTGELLDNDAVAADVVASDDTSATGDGDGKTTAPDVEGNQPETPAPVQQKTVEPPAPKLDSPGEFQPKDYSFDVALADGTTVRIEKPEDIEKLPTDADFGSPKNLMEAQAKYSRMLSGIEADRREYEAKADAFKKQEDEAAEVSQRVEVMVNEMNYLESKGKLPKVDAKYENADWSDPEVAKQAGIKERLELLEFRAKENEQRQKLGLSPMSVLEASREMADQIAERQAEDQRQKQNTLRKQKGAMVSGPGGMPTSNMPDDMIVGVGGSIRDIGM